MTNFKIVLSVILLLFFISTIFHLVALAWRNGWNGKDLTYVRGFWARNLGKILIAHVLFVIALMSYIIWGGY